MSRLTEFIEKMEEQSCYHIPLCKEDGICKEESCPISEAIEAIKELQHYKDLEEQGRLIELPCKVGDTVWIADGVHEPWQTIHTNIAQIVLVISYGWVIGYTKEEAEEALKRLQSNE